MVATPIFNSLQRQLPTCPVDTRFYWVAPRTMSTPKPGARPVGQRKRKVRR